MQQPFSPNPQWRRNFEFTVSYPNPDKKYTLDPIIVYNEPILEFTLDPVLNKFNSKNS